MSQPYLIDPIPNTYVINTKPGPLLQGLKGGVFIQTCIYPGFTFARYLSSKMLRYTCALIVASVLALSTEARVRGNGFPGERLFCGACMQRLKESTRRIAELEARLQQQHIFRNARGVSPCTGKFIKCCYGAMNDNEVIDYLIVIGRQ